MILKKISFYDEFSDITYFLTINSTSFSFPTLSL